MAIGRRGVGEQVRRLIVRALGLGGVEAQVEEAREAAARAGLAASAAVEAARRAEGAAASILALSQSPVWYHSDMPESQGTGVHLTEGHDKVSGLPDRHDRMAGGSGGATGRAWRVLDYDIETLD